MEAWRVLYGKILGETLIVIGIFTGHILIQRANA